MSTVQAPLQPRQTELAECSVCACRTGLDCRCRVSATQVAWLTLTGILHALQAKGRRHAQLITALRALLQQPQYRHMPGQLGAVVTSPQHQVFDDIG